MRKFTVVLLSIALSITTIYPAVAAVKAGSSCSKIGSNSISSGKLFTCIKSGKKLIWNNGVINTPKISEPARPSSFDDIYTNATGISYWAWKLSAENIKKSKPADIVEHLYVGPNSNPILKDPKWIFERASQMYPLAKAPSIVHVIVYNFADVNWAQSKFEALDSKSDGPERADRAFNNCRSADNCIGASLDITKTNEFIILYTVQSQDKIKNENVLNGEVYAHEFTHNIMDAQMTDRAAAQQQVTNWFWEGVATYSQTAIIHNQSYDEYYAAKRKLADQLYRDKTINEDWYNKFLSSTSSDFRFWRDNYEHWRLYDVGMFVTEILVATYGVDILMDVFKKIGQGMTWEEAFEATYMVKWSDLRPIFAKTIVKMIKGY